MSVRSVGAGRLAVHGVPLNRGLLTRRAGTQSDIASPNIQQVTYTSHFDVPTALSVTGVLRPLVHVCGTGCQLIYGSVIVSEDS